jgi:hypothetical protein
MKKFQTLEQVKQYFAGETIECLLCGKQYKSLATHIQRIHNVSVDDYKIKYGLPFSIGLVAEETRKKYSNAMLLRIEAGDKTLMPISKVAHKGQQSKNRFQPFAKHELSERLKQINKSREPITRLQMEQYVSFFEQKKIRPWEIQGRENKFGIICSATFSRHKNKHKDICDRYEKIISEIPSRRIGKRRLRLEIIKDVEQLKKQGLSSVKIASIVGVGRTTVKRIIKKEGVWC